MADTVNKTGEIGFTGLVQYSGRIQEDFLREFHGKEAYKRFNEMRLNNATIGAGLLAIEYMIRSMSWNFTSEEENDPWVELCDESRNAMTQSWNDFISEVLSMIWAGFSVHEIVYQKDERKRYLWRKFPIRGQDTIYQWLFDDKGGLAGIRQTASNYRQVDIPIEKLILFRMKSERNNPEGRSLLRTAWVSYYYLKNLQQVEAIGFERDAAGIPKITLPSGANTNESDTNSDASKAAKIVRNIRNDEQAGIVIPDGWVFELLSSSGKSFDAFNATIERYDKRLATSFFSQFLLLGQSGVGSLALSENATDFFMAAVNAVADIISETFTKFGVYRLLKLNGASEEEARRVKMEHTPANSVDISKIGGFLGQVKDLLTLDEGDELWIRQLAGMPERDKEQLKVERESIQAEKRAAAQRIQDNIRNARQEENTRQEGRDDNKVDLYATGAPDEDVRSRLEQQTKDAINDHFAKMLRRVMKSAQEIRS